MNSLRIIGGHYRRRVLRFPDNEGLRPTPDRVRETLFNWLGQELDGLRCLDLFACSGALGFEALSRVVQAPKVLAALRANAEMLGSPGALEIMRGDALQYAASTKAKFDLIFLDPPFKKAGLPAWNLWFPAWRAKMRPSTSRRSRKSPPLASGVRCATARRVKSIIS